jgi:tRNA (guanosine-2'-O-)-methyltransferase
MRRDDPDAYEVPSREGLIATAAEVVRVLSPLVTEARLARMKAVVAERSATLVVVLEELTDPHNGSAIMRSADAFGVQEVHVIPSQHGFLAAHRVAKGTHRWLDITRHHDAEACVEALHARGFEVLVAAMDGELTPEDLAKRERVAVVFGNEHAGASRSMRGEADGSFAIPMYGFVESLNVSVAAAVTLSTASKGHRGNLSEARAEELLAQYLMTSVKDAGRVVRERLGAAEPSSG